MKTALFRHQFAVPASAIDGLNHVNSIVYLQWCLDVAEAHWISKTGSRLRENYVWVALNHSISYKAPAFVDEVLEIQTWIESYAGVKCNRHYRIVRLSDKKTLVEANTLWCLLNGKTFRPTRITTEISTLFV